jgi:hypothetical protein
MIGHVIRRMVMVAAVAAVPLALVAPASAAGEWLPADLSDIAQVPASATAATAPFGYETALNGQANVARIVYRTMGGDIEELSVQGGGQWHPADLSTDSPEHAPAAASAPFGYVTSLAGHTAARVVYQTTGGDIEEFSTGNGEDWQPADLTARTNAPAAASAPSGYDTFLAQQPESARVVYQTTGGDIEELSVQGGGDWLAADLNVKAHAPATARAASAPFGYFTILDEQGSVARVIYRIANGHIEELNVS